MEQLPLFAFDDTPADRNAQQLVAIREYLHVWTEVERRKRLEEVMRLSLSGSTGNAAQQGSFQADNPAASRAGHSGGR